MECSRPINSVLPRFYTTWSSQTRPSMRIQRSEGLGSRIFYPFLWLYSDDMVWIPCSGTVLRGQDPEVLLGHEQLDDIMRVPGHPV